MYNYEVEKPKLFTDEGQRDFLKVRDFVNKCLKLSGAVRMQEAISCICGDNWLALACVDRLVELEELYEIVQKNDIPIQHRIFVAGRLNSTL